MVLTRCLGDCRCPRSELLQSKVCSGEDTLERQSHDTIGEHMQERPLAVIEVIASKSLVRQKMGFIHHEEYVAGSKATS
jgi:hypothetical protein